MQRQKVNGNGIRAAGNPDEEPVFSQYPVCPPTRPAEYMGGSQLAVPQAHFEAAPSQILEPNNEGKFVPRNCNGYQVSFPLKLHRILDKLEADNNVGTISWLPHGRAFIVRDPDRFVNELMPVYFNQTKYSSFQRQLHMYNFQRITAGCDKGAYHHPFFQRGRPQIALRMQRTRVNGKGTRRPGNPEAEPHFDLLDPLPHIPFGAKIEIPLEVSSSGSPDGEDSVVSIDET
jgi:HSF-type DNA-binding